MNKKVYFLFYFRYLLLLLLLLIIFISYLCYLKSHVCTIILDFLEHETRLLVSTVSSIRWLLFYERSYLIVQFSAVFFFSFLYVFILISSVIRTTLSFLQLSRFSAACSFSLWVRSLFIIISLACVELTWSLC